MNYPADLALGDNYQLLPNVSGDALTRDGTAALLQDIRLEAVTKEGDLWYDPEYGWGLQDFCHSPADALTLAELRQRVSNKLARRTQLDISSIRVEEQLEGSEITGVKVAFRLADDATDYELLLSIGRVQVEVIQLD